MLSKTELPANDKKAEIIVNQEQRLDTAQDWHNLASKSGLIHYLCLMVIHDNGFYKELGFNKFEDYAKELWVYTRSTAFNRLKIASKIRKSIGIDLNLNSVQQIGLVEENQQYELVKPENRHLKDFFKLPYTKQLLIAQFLTQQEFDNLIQTGKARFNSHTLTIQEMGDTQRDSLRRLVKGEKRVKIVKEKSDTIPFKVVYKRAEKIFNILTFDIGHCPVFGKHDIDRIEFHIVKLVEIYDQFVQKIPSNELDKNEIKT